ncbi:MAG: dephospho-CoA kinase [Alphaproteobacteria bacterium]|nr:dephospho-CoA kinase [Alphaproteobacteria bacterium]
MIILGITGSIGMGKSTIGSMLEYLGVPVHESDHTVREMLQFGSPAWFALAAEFPYFSYPQIYGKHHFFNPFKESKRYLKRDALGQLVFDNERERKKLEGVLHPFVRQAQNNFIKKHRTLGKDIVALDIPLLFETGADQRLDHTLVVTAPAFLQARRVLSRPKMTLEKFEGILKSQMPDGEKVARADFVIHSGLGRAYTMKELKKVLHTLRSKPEEEAA